MIIKFNRKKGTKTMFKKQIKIKLRIFENGQF